MATNYYQAGDVIDFTAASDIASGSVVVVGNLVGVAHNDITTGATGPVGITGVYAVPKVSAAVIGAGQTVNYDVSAGAFDDNLAIKAAGDLSGGCVAVEPAGNGDTLVMVKLNVGANTVT